MVLALFMEHLHRVQKELDLVVLFLTEGRALLISHVCEIQGEFDFAFSFLA